MRIKLEKFYQNTKGQQVQAGEHDASELPNGLAQYLVDNGHATVIEADSAPVKRTRADKTLTPSEVISLDETDDETEKADDDDVKEYEPEVLRAEYEALAGEAPPWNIKLETLRARVEELRDEE